MNHLLALWLPILLSAVVVFVISSLIHMVFKWHASDYGRLANEDAVREAVRAGAAKPGRYVIPYCADMKDMASESMQRKYAEGPIAHFTVGPNGQPNMGKYLGLWFAWSLVVAIIAAFLTTQTVGTYPQFARKAAKLFGSIVFIAHGFGTVTESIWMMRPWSSTAKYLLDSALYAVGSGLVFYWLWD